MSGTANPSSSRMDKGKEVEVTQPPRLFYFKGTGEDFIRQFNEVLANRDSSLEKTLQAISDNLAALTAALLDRGKSSSPPPTSRTVTPATSSQLTPDIDVTPPLEEEEPLHEHSERQSSLSSAPNELRDPRYLPPQKHTMATLSPAPQRPLLIRELSVPPTPAQQGSGNQDGRLPLSTLLPKFKGHDGENVIFWLHEMECLFVMYNVLEKNKVYNATRYLDGEAQKFYMYLVTINDGRVPT